MTYFQLTIFCHFSCFKRILGMNYEISGGDSGNISSPSNDKQRRPTEEKSLVPVTIGMAKRATNNILQDGREPEQIKIVGAVCDATNKSTSIEYALEDGTGKIAVKEWVEDGNKVKEQMSAEAAVDHQYIRVIGKIQEYEGELQIVAQHVKKLTDANELTYHLLEVVRSAEKYKRSSNIVGSPSMAMSHMQLNHGVSLHASKPIGMGGEGDGGLQNEIMNFLKGFDESVGGNINEFIATHSQYGESQVRATVEALSTEGMIYSTIDENHYSAIM